ncbi:MAG: NAD(P)-binding domain-containing protein [Chloroflexota bacterium]|nr:NAD(P)-binding domain-containing protein [Chloroflexota bacterium]MDE2854136.1 NAD(P)-binding domain-containing protein [Chloroflexota bacterium]MDE2948490.1 NAD(P)-binding domain-containing protein [Chloroflexota bacterium]
MATIYREADANLNVLSGKTVGIIGYGNLGRPVANNLRDSGVRLLVGLREDETREHAREDGFEPQDIEKVIPRCHILMLFLPDEVVPEVYLERISPFLQRGHLLVFASGYNIAFGFVEPPPFVDVGMIAPRTIGAAVRSRYLDGSGFYSFVGVGQDATGSTLETLLGLAKAMGSLGAGAIEISMEQESQLDLFVQQAILPAFHHVLSTAAEVLLELGYPPEAVMLDLVISGEFTDYLSRASQMGWLRALRLSSLTGQYGLFSRLSRFKELKLEGLMEATLDEIRQGDFAIEWSREYEQGYPRLAGLLSAQEGQHLFALVQGTLERLK